MVSRAKPYRIRASDLKPAWHVVDARGKTLGRLSTEIAVLLQGKHKPTYVPYLNSGDFVVVVNVEKIRVTGNKLNQKMYYRHSGYHGGLKEQSLAVLLKRTPTRAIRHAVKGMLPKNSLGRRMLSRLKLYTGDTHPHEAQLNARPKPARAETRVRAAPRARVTQATVESEEVAVVKAPAQAAALVTGEPTPPRKRRAAARPRARKAEAAPKASASRAKSKVSDEAIAEASPPEMAAEDKRAKSPKTTSAKGAKPTRRRQTRTRRKSS